MRRYASVAAHVTAVCELCIVEKPTTIRFRTLAGESHNGFVVCAGELVILSIITGGLSTRDEHSSKEPCGAVGFVTSDQGAISTGDETPSVPPTSHLRREGTWVSESKLSIWGCRNPSSTSVTCTAVLSDGA